VLSAKKHLDFSLGILSKARSSQLIKFTFGLIALVTFIPSASLPQSKEFNIPAQICAGAIYNYQENLSFSEIDERTFMGEIRKFYIEEYFKGKGQKAPHILTMIYTESQWAETVKDNFSYFEQLEIVDQCVNYAKHKI
jgi:hypothetical protein